MVNDGDGANDGHGEYHYERPAEKRSNGSEKCSSSYQIQWLQTVSPHPCKNAKRFSYFSSIFVLLQLSVFLGRSLSVWCISTW